MEHHIDIAYQSINHLGEELCGDKVEIVRSGSSTILVLADGMGSGVKANILSTLTSKIISTMLREGSTVDEAVETIASTLPICKVRKLAYSTFSILEIFRDGRARLVEYGNPPWIVLRKGKLLELPSATREIAGKEVREAAFQMEEGDTVALMSDGIIHAGAGVTINQGWQWEEAAQYLEECLGKGMSLSRTVLSLMQVVDSLYLSEPGDDCTLAMAQMVPCQPVSLFTGPPSDPAMDRQAVEDWMASPGVKVVSGGTTANLVGRVLGKSVETALEPSSDPSIPPIARIQGVDLVTEGVLTLNRTVQILERFRTVTVDGSYQSFKELDAKNGAAMLARLLLERCTHLYLFVGQAVNPAHENASLPVDLTIRSRLVKDLSRLMQEMGKTVTVRYY